MVFSVIDHSQWLAPTICGRQWQTKATFSAAHKQIATAGVQCFLGKALWGRRTWGEKVVWYYKSNAKCPTTPAAVITRKSITRVRGNQYLAMQHMLQPTAEQIINVLVVQSVEDISAFFTSSYQVHLPQMAHMVGYSRFADSHRSRQRAHVHFAIRQRGNDTAPTSVA